MGVLNSNGHIQNTPFCLLLNIPKYLFYIRQKYNMSFMACDINIY